MLCQNQSWREASEILKHCVTRSSDFETPPPNKSLGVHAAMLPDASITGLGSHTSFAEAELTVKKELPGGV